jgi:hypothetical protein
MLLFTKVWITEVKNQVAMLPRRLKSTTLPLGILLVWASGHRRMSPSTEAPYPFNNCHRFLLTFIAQVHITLTVVAFVWAGSKVWRNHLGISHTWPACTNCKSRDHLPATSVGVNPPCMYSNHPSYYQKFCWFIFHCNFHRVFMWVKHPEHGFPTARWRCIIRVTLHLTALSVPALRSATLSTTLHPAIRRRCTRENNRERFNVQNHSFLFLDSFMQLRRVTFLIFICGGEK